MTDQAWESFENNHQPFKGVSAREAALLDMGLNPDDFVESKIDPALFALAPWPNAYKDADYPCVPCAMCGHMCRWIVGFVHAPSSEIIYVGEDCAHYLDSENLVEKQMKMFKTSQKNKAETLARLAANQEWRAANSDVVNFLHLTEAKETAWREAEKPAKIKAPLPFMLDMVYAYNKYGSLTENQTNAVKKIMVKQAEFDARKEEEKPEEPLFGGKRLLEGEVVFTDWRDGYYNERVKKMVVKLLDGNKVWGTVPKSIHQVRVGEKVSLFGNVEVSKNDENFGFFKNPSKAVVERV